ncbi:CDP-alcohol phosphatidyltransferase domain-containing protein [Rozella allomycis CSF55]|uniref:CDP-diacylglycerol--inositol 3-phosphatidyltransferase n=1 Tax=Rozella allomycis (strain CSF55) TaxID=988480 RepID=A0A075ARJ4_ROZAC|nr:CDP-alcohol phosphatidyltransferase domain-containing protein [Rozella allomycis CSF55]|eukprot:EPZ31346.1 CDP-alcohol phosphatidyltransferase domain-containing protein [Rozella allomycis CSF55]
MQINYHGYAIVVYLLSSILDAFDGLAARYFNQCSELGAVLDMVTDRSTTAGLICYLCILYPNFCMIFQFLLGLDLSSHYIQMFSSLRQGESSHKNVKDKGWSILKLYYTNRTALFLVCAFAELFYVFLYIIKLEQFEFMKSFTTNALYVVFPVWLLKQVINVIQLKRGCQILVSIQEAQKKN